MSAPKLDPALASEIAELRSGTIRHADAQEIVEVVQTIIESMNRDIPSIDAAVRDDLEDLAGYIRETKNEIMRLSPEEISKQHLPSASLELDAIVSGTEQATHSIMEAAERIERLGECLGAEQGSRLTDATTQIYEACGFQDITGQRIGKVVRALQEIERKVDDLIGAFGDDGDAARDERRRAREVRRQTHGQDAKPDGELLEGPQLPDAAISQDDVDALFQKRG